MGLPRSIGIGYWQNQSANDLWTRAEVENLAYRYDKFLTRYDPQVSWIKSVEPSRVVSYYRSFEAVYYHSAPSGITPQEWLDGGSVASPPDPWNEFTDFVANGAVLVNALGNYLVNSGFTNERMVDPGNAWYRHYLRELLKYKVALGYGYIFADCLRYYVDMTPWHYGTTNGSTVQPPPINPRTGLVYTDDEYAADVRGLIDYIKSGTGIIIVGNGIPQGNGSWGYYEKRPDLANLLIEKADGQMIEGPWGWNASDFLNRSQSAYQQNLNLLRLLMRPDKISELTNMSINNVMFSFCSHMLIVEQGYPFYIKYGSWPQMETPEWMALTDYDYGTPLEGYQVNGSVFSRRFTKAVFYVNFSTKTTTIEYLEPDLVNLSYSSVPSGIDAEVGGVALPDGGALQVERNTQVTLRVPRQAIL